MDDKTLLELSAVAAGIKIDKSAYNGGGAGNDGFDACGNVVLNWHDYKTWNPLTDDGDALRLAVSLQIVPIAGDLKCVAQWWIRPAMIELDSVVEISGSDEFAATRRAIVRAAAIIGKARP